MVPRSFFLICLPANGVGEAMMPNAWPRTRSSAGWSEMCGVGIRCQNCGVPMASQQHKPAQLQPLFLVTTTGPLFPSPLIKPTAVADQSIEKQSQRFSPSFLFPKQIHDSFGISKGFSLEKRLKTKSKKLPLLCLPTTFTSFLSSYK